MAAKRARRWCIALIVLLVLYTTFRFTLYLIVQTKLHEIRKQGYPVTLAELNKWYPQPPPGENAADVYRNAFAKDVRPDDAGSSLPIVGYADLPPRGETLSEATMDGISYFLKTNHESLVLLHTAAAVAHCRFVTNLDISMIQHTQDSGLRQGTRKLTLEAIYNAELGDDKSTTEALVASIRLVRHFSDEPQAISRLVQQACFGFTFEALERSLTQIQLDSNQLDSVSSALAVTEASLNINNILVSELAWNDDVFSRIRQGKTLAAEFLMMDLKGDISPPTWYWLPYCLAYQFGGIEEIDQLNYLHLTAQAMLVARDPFPKRIGTLDSLGQQTERSPKLLPLSRFDSHMNCQYLKLDARFIANLRTARAGLSVESYRNEHGQLPDSLPFDLTDPFDGQPLRYKKLAKGYVVYSVGEDGKDDSGDEKKDITFTVER